MRKINKKTSFNIYKNNLYGVSDVNDINIELANDIFPKSFQSRNHAEVMKKIKESKKDSKVNNDNLK